MSLDRSLKTSASLARHRNVLSRAERVAKLVERGRFDTSMGNPLHLPKVGNRKAVVAKAAKKDAAPAEGGAAAPAAPAAKGGAPAKGGVPAKGAAPAAGAKPAAKAAAKK